MRRFNLAEKVKQEQQFNLQQHKLKEKYNIDQDVIVVEKSNAYKFTVKLLIAFLKLIASFSLIVLAFIGLITLVYPQIRNEFLMLLHEIFLQIQSMI